MLAWTIIRKPAGGSTHWSSRKLAVELGDVLHMRIARIWVKHALKSQCMERNVASNDPDFEAETCRRLRNVKIRGQVAYQEVGTLFYCATIFINTPDVEGFPNTCLQAWIRGLPVVATFDQDGIITCERLGVRVLSTGELVETVYRILGNRADFEGMRQRCLQYIPRCIQRG